MDLVELAARMPGLTSTERLVLIAALVLAERGARLTGTALCKAAGARHANGMRAVKTLVDTGLLRVVGEIPTRGRAHRVLEPAYDEIEAASGGLG